MSEGFKRVYLRSWVQIKERFGRDWFTLFQVDLGFIFFFYFFWVWKGSSAAGFRGQLAALSLWENEGEGWLVYLLQCRTHQALHDASQSPSRPKFLSLVHFQPQPLFPNLFISALST